MFCLCLRSGQRQECNNEEIFRESQLRLYGQGGNHPQDWEMGLVSAIVLVLSVPKVLVATVEGNSLISVLWMCSLVILCSRGCWVSLCWWLLLMGRGVEAFCPPGSLWAVLHRWQKQQSEFPSGGTNTLPQQNLRQVLVESCMMLISSLSPSWSLALILLRNHSGPAEMVCLMVRELQLSVYQDLSTQQAPAHFPNSCKRAAAWASPQVVSCERTPGELGLLPGAVPCWWQGRGSLSGASDYFITLNTEKHLLGLTCAVFVCSSRNLLNPAKMWTQPLLVTPKLLYFNKSVLQKSWKLLGECWPLHLELMNSHHCSCHSKGGRVALFP